MTAAPAPILQVDDLSIGFATDDGFVPAVRGVSFDVPAGKTVALLGESGCGKSVTARAVLNFIDKPGRAERGAVRLRAENGGETTDLLQLDPDGKTIRDIRWGQIAMIFQNPGRSLTPAYTVGEQMVEAIRLHLNLSKQEARAKAIEGLREVGIPAPERRIDDYPHQMSGGMCQRVMIAMALSCEPRLLIADEPTTALDVTIQAQVLRLLKKMQRDHGTSILLITHDMGVVAEMADEVVVMYLGKVVERGPVDAIFDDPKHPYTQKLFASTPRADLAAGAVLPSIPGAVPDHLHIPEGCPFRGRCEHEFEACTAEPTTVTISGGHRVACHLHTPDITPGSPRPRMGVTS